MHQTGSSFRHQKQSIKVLEGQFVTNKIMALFYCLMIDIRIQTEIVLQLLETFQIGLKAIGEQVRILINFLKSFHSFMQIVKNNFLLKRKNRIAEKMKEIFLEAHMPDTCCDFKKLSIYL